MQKTKIKILLGVLALYIGISVQAQQFPQSFIGHWEGNLQWFQTGKKLPQNVKMQLIIQPADTAGHFTWQLMYGDKGQDNRPYVLKPVDTAKGHWVVDERNGILLDEYWTGNRLHCAFTVQSTTIINSYWLEGDKLMIEFFSLSAKPVRASGYGTEESPNVDSYSVKGFQKAVLKRRSNKMKK
jgi:hypothetical protein